MTVITKGKTGWNVDVDNYLQEIIAARGSAPSLDARMDVSINDDGTLKTPAPGSGWWTQEPDSVTYVSATSFTVTGDKTAIYLANRGFKADVTAGIVYSHVDSASYDSGSGLTTVVIKDAVLDSGLSAVYYGQPPHNQPLLSAGNNVSVSESSGVQAVSAIAPLGGKTGGDLEVSAAGSDVTIKPGYREVGGQWYHWNSALSFTIGSGGSNPDSEAAPSSADLVYIYIDASKLPSDPATELTAANFISKQTEPVWSDSKHGWYDGDDRCIGALKHDGTNLIRQVKSGRYHYYSNRQSEISTTNLDQALTFAWVPPNGAAVSVFLHADSDNSAAAAESIIFYETDGTAAHGVVGYWYTDSVLRLMITGYVPFVREHNILWVKMSNSDTVAVVETIGFIYAEGI